MVAPVFLYSGQIPNAATALVTAPASGVYVIRRASFANTSGAPVALTVWLTPSGAPGAASVVLPGIVLPAGTTYTCPELSNQVLSGGAVLYGLAASAGAITGTISGLSA